MKNPIYNIAMFAGLFLFALSLNSCKDDEKGGSNSSPVVVSKFYLEDAASTVPDREVNFVRLGQVLRLEGSGFMGVTNIYINGLNTFFNPALMTDNNMWVSISNDTPTIGVDESIMNTIVLKKGDNEYRFDFDIRSAAPRITSISHTMPQALEEITIYGSGLQRVESVTFPGGVVVTDGIVSDDVDGKFCVVTVPEGVSDEGGSILVIGANGGAYSPAYFNFKKGLLHNFDDINNFEWASGIDAADRSLNAPIPASAGNLPTSQGAYALFNSGANLAAGNSQRYWLNGDLVKPMIDSEQIFPLSTPTEQLAIQMDIYVEGEWNSGLIRYVVRDGAGTTRYCMLYAPVYTNWDATTYLPTVYNPKAYVNPGCWYTITLPLTDSKDFLNMTLADVKMGEDSNTQTGPWFENSGIKVGDDVVFDPVPATEKVYFDNIRLVSLVTPAYSDFAD